MDEDNAVANATFLVFKRGITSANILRIHNINSIVDAGSGIKFAIIVAVNFGAVCEKAAMGFIRSGTVVLSTVFAYFDVSSLIACWKSKHPNMAQVEEIIKKFKEELQYVSEQS
ncbi:hypothetical protein BpHYR1_044917 [Brachionus plicatilis]|uniref:Uncharacterized protein n=1 Tax=Brachionus plicatilis TaxID=10195 RepID=A0A3M7SIU3_BRAPC|nr:hypothetical protein BpHYR1_044917 [Brachionus plicatilis]